MRVEKSQRRPPARRAGASSACGARRELFGLDAEDGSILWTIILGIGLALFGFYLPNIILYQSAYNRSERILKDLPDALDLLVISVESGLGFDAALSQVARNTTGPLADEFFRVLQEMQLGTSPLESRRPLAAAKTPETPGAERRPHGACPSGTRGTASVSEIMVGGEGIEPPTFSV